MVVRQRMQQAGYRLFAQVFIALITLIVLMPIYKESLFGQQLLQIQQNFHGPWAIQLDGD